MTDIEVKKAFNTIMDYCNDDRLCEKCVFWNNRTDMCLVREFPFVHKFDIEEGSESDE